MSEQMLFSYKWNITEDKKKRIFNCCDESSNKVLIFLNSYFSKNIKSDIIFNYCDEVNIRNTNSKILLGKLLNFDFKSNIITVMNHKEYKPYYDETNIVYQYRFEELGITELIDIVIIKFLYYFHKENKKNNGVYDFPKYVILKAKKNRQKNKLCKILNIDREHYSEEKYQRIIEKYIILFYDLYSFLIE